MSAEAVLEALARAIAPYVARELAAKIEPVYTRTNLPPGRSLRWWREHAARIPGAVPCGRGWAVPCASWRAFEAAEAERRRGVRKAAPVRELEAPAANDVDTMLEAAGLRRTR